MDVLLRLGVGALLGVAATPAVLAALGFTSVGVAAGSFAAWLQSQIGIVSAGSLFALCQSIGATGLAAGTNIVLGALGAITAMVL